METFNENDIYLSDVEEDFYRSEEEEDELYMGSNTNISTPNNLKRKRKVTFADEKGNNFPLVRIAPPSILFPHDIEFDISPDNEDRSSKLSWMTWHWTSEPTPNMGSGLPFDMLNSHQYDPLMMQLDYIPFKTEDEIAEQAQDSTLDSDSDDEEDLIVNI